MHSEAPHPTADAYVLSLALTLVTVPAGHWVVLLAAVPNPMAVGDLTSHDQSDAAVDAAAAGQPRE